MSQTPQPSAASIVMREKRERQRRKRRRLIWAGSTAGAVVFILLFCFLILPPIVKSQAVKRLSAELHREVAIERIRINPLMLSVTIDGLEIKDRDGGPFTSWRRLYVNFDSFSLFTGEWRFQEIALEGFSQRVAVAEDGTFNFADLIPAPSETPQTEPASPPRPIRIARLTVTSASVAFADASRGQPFATDIGPLSFTLIDFLTAGDAKAPYEFSAVTEAGETFSWRGTLSINPVRSAGEFSLGGITLKKYAPYYRDFINADLLDGALDVSAHYAIDLGESSRELTLTRASIKVSRLQVAERGGGEPLIDLPSIQVEGFSADGLKPSATISSVELKGGRLSVVRESDGSINLLKLLAPPVESAPPPPAVPAPQPATPATPAGPLAGLPDVKLAHFGLSGLAIDIEDRTTPTPAKNAIGGLEVVLKNFSLAEPAAPVLLKVLVDALPSGSLAVEGTATREPLKADVQVKLDAFPLAGLTPYVEPMLNLRITGGVVSVDGFARLDGAAAYFQGNTIVEKFTTVDGARGEDFAKFTRLEIRGIQAGTEPLTAHIAEISLVDPQARIVVLEDKSTNLATILCQPAPGSEGGETVKPAPAADAPESQGPEPVWSLGKFTLSNGGVVLADRSIKPAVRMSLDQFSGTITGLSSADKQRADVDIRGKVNGAGSVSLKGKLDAKAATRVPDALTQLEIDVKGVDLAPISPYVGTYAGYELVRSGLTVDVKARLARRNLDTNNVVTLQQFTLGAATNSPEATKLPVRLGVALLKDTDGNIVIDIPVKGDLDDPEFKIGRVVMRVIVNLLTKAATSPFSLIGAAFGGGGDELSYQDFIPGTTMTAEGELQKIDTLRKALKARPGLNLDISGGFDPQADLAAMRELILAKQVRFRRWEELRRQNPDTPPPADIEVTPEDEARIIGVFVAERYPGGVPAASEDGTIAPPPPTFAPLPQPEEKPKPAVRRAVTTHRNQRVFTTRGVLRTEPAKEPEPAVPAVVLAPSAEATAASPDGAPALTLEAARAALAAGIPVPEDDLLQLAADRAQRVRDALLEGGEIAPERLFLTPPAPEGKGAKVFLQLR